MGHEGLLAVIDAYIKKNGNREITGEVLNGVLHSIVEGLDYDKAIAALQPKSAPSLATKDKTVVGSINEIYNSLGSIDGKISGKQDKTDQSLKTSDKTVVGSINEVYGSLGDIDAILDEINGEEAL